MPSTREVAAMAVTVAGTRKYGIDFSNTSPTHRPSEPPMMMSWRKEIGFGVPRPAMVAGAAPEARSSESATTPPLDSVAGPDPTRAPKTPHTPAGAARWVGRTCPKYQH